MQLGLMTVATTVVTLLASFVLRRRRIYTQYMVNQTIGE
jgi:hypothetical protein